uniref:Uncharacterized protein n=1 Tax=Asparagus officinalis TaxID=4686 RepID=Q2AA36_ASPOF|nr:hypothetical protein 20.t00046 [Asparagus officinalis]
MENYLKAPLELQKAPQYLIDLMAPIVARMATIEELVASHIASPTPLPPAYQP